MQSLIFSAQNVVFDMYGHEKCFTFNISNNTRYVVQPYQGILNSGQDQQIKIQLLENSKNIDIVKDRFCIFYIDLKEGFQDMNFSEIFQKYKKILQKHMMKVKFVNEQSFAENSSLSNFHPKIMQSIVLNVPKNMDQSDIYSRSSLDDLSSNNFSNIEYQSNRNSISFNNRSLIDKLHQSNLKNSIAKKTNNVQISFKANKEKPWHNTYNESQTQTRANKSPQISHMKVNQSKLSNDAKNFSQQKFKEQIFILEQQVLQKERLIQKIDLVQPQKIQTKENIILA